MNIKIGITHKKFEEFQDRLVKLTGDIWCPYPHDFFVHVLRLENESTIHKLSCEIEHHLNPEVLK